MGINSGVEFAAADLGNVIRGAVSSPSSGVQAVTDAQLIALHEQVIDSFIGQKQGQTQSASQAQPVQGKFTAALADKAAGAAHITISVT